MSNEVYDILGVGIGPFNLSLAALSEPLENLKCKFLDNKEEFRWHPELMFSDATMQTSYLKDLVTPVDPTNPYSFLNYLVKKGQLYHFMNTDRKAVTRVEFEDYCRWVSQELGDTLEFNQSVREVTFDGESFHIKGDHSHHQSRHLCIASGPVKNIPTCAQEFLGEDVFHAKSPLLPNADFTGQRVLIVGGGQTGVEVFKNALEEKWGKCESLCLVSGRENLVSLEEGPFTNDIFTPEFVNNFHSLPQRNKDRYTGQLLLASDGNTPEFLDELYRSLYMDRFYHHRFSPYCLCPMRWMEKIEKEESGLLVTVKNLLSGQYERKSFDRIILATGFQTALPQYLEPLLDSIEKDELGRPLICKDYKLQWDNKDHHIYAMNYSRHMHGIADPQTSLMSWRSSVIINSLLGEKVYNTREMEPSFLNFFSHQGFSS